MYTCMYLLSTVGWTCGCVSLGQSEVVLFPNPSWSLIAASWWKQTSTDNILVLRCSDPSHSDTLPSVFQRSKGTTAAVPNSELCSEAMDSWRQTIRPGHLKPRGEGGGGRRTQEETSFFRSDFSSRSWKLLFLVTQAIGKDFFPPSFLSLELLLILNALQNHVAFQIFETSKTETGMFKKSLKIARCQSLES